MRNSVIFGVNMSGASTSHSPPPMASISDVSALFQNAKKYEELNVIGTGEEQINFINNLILHVPVDKLFAQFVEQVNFSVCYFFSFFSI